MHRWSASLCSGLLLSSLCAARQVAAGKVLSEACNAVGNRDIEPFIPALVSAVARPAEVPDCVHKLSATTFVQARPARRSFVRRIVYTALC